MILQFAPHRCASLFQHRVNTGLCPARPELEMTLSTPRSPPAAPSASSRPRVRRSSRSGRSPVATCAVRARREPWTLVRALTLHRLSATTASLHVAPYGGSRTMVNPRQVLAFAPWRDRSASGVKSRHVQLKKAMSVSPRKWTFVASIELSARGRSGHFSFRDPYEAR